MFDRLYLYLSLCPPNACSLPLLKFGRSQKRDDVGIGTALFGRVVVASVRVYWPSEPPCSEEEDCVDPLHSNKMARFCLGWAVIQRVSKTAEVRLEGFLTVLGRSGGGA